MYLFFVVSITEIVFFFAQNMFAMFLLDRILLAEFSSQTLNIHKELFLHFWIK